MCTVIGHVDFDYTPTPSPIYPVDGDNPAPHWVITASEFQINTYDFHLWDNNPLCEWDTVVWSFDELSFGDSLEWLLEPSGDQGKYCKVFVLNHVEDTVWLTAHVFNRCAPEEGIEQRYWLLCSFYGVDEQEENKADFSVIPNPNNGQMMLSFEHFMGKIDVKVYDMKGGMIDHFQTNNDSKDSIISYELHHHSSGMYFFVVTGREGTVTKKVIVE